MLLACARNRLDSESIEQIQTIAAEGEADWALVIRRAIDHGLTPLLAWNLARCGTGSLPVELATALHNWLTENRARNLELAREALAIVHLLGKRNIPAIPIKGPVLAKTLFGDLGLRQSGDLDFLVPRQHVSSAVALLGSRGYELKQLLSAGQDAAYRRYYSDFEMHRPGPNIMAEVHWDLMPRVMAVRFDIDGLWRRARTIPFEGGEVLSLSPEDYLIFLCVHGSKHFWYRLNWICDIHEFVSTQTKIDWGRCLGLARKQGCERMLLLGLALAESLLQTEIPEPVRDRLHADPKARQLAGQIEADFFRDEERRPNIFEAFRPFLPLRERFRDKLLYCWRQIATPRVNHFGIVSLPRSLWFLYVPIKVAYDYGWRPLVRPWKKDLSFRQRAFAKRPRKHLRRSLTTGLTIQKMGCGDGLNPLGAGRGAPDVLQPENGWGKRSRYREHEASNCLENIST